MGDDLISTIFFKMMDNITTNSIKITNKRKIKESTLRKISQEFMFRELDFEIKSSRILHRSGYADFFIYIDFFEKKTSFFSTYIKYTNWMTSLQSIFSRKGKVTFPLLNCHLDLEAHVKNKNLFLVANINGNFFSFYNLDDFENKLNLELETKLNTIFS